MTTSVYSGTTKIPAKSFLLLHVLLLREKGKKKKKQRRAADLTDSGDRNH